MIHAILWALLWAAVAIICLFIVYSGLPNLWVRVLHQHAKRDIPAYKSGNPQVSLTFDDGPDAKYTPRLLDALKQANVRATFFVIAEKAERNPEIIRRMLQEGHDIQVHGYRHLMVPFLLPASTVMQVVTSSRVLREKFGVETSWYRPTWGLSNLVTFMSKACQSHRLITWSVMVGDWKRTSVDVLLERIEKKLHPGAVIVLHDSDETFGADEGAPESVIELMPLLVDTVRGLGYVFTPVGDAFRIE